MRAARSIKLLAQRRHVENHMRCQSRAVKDQQAMFNDSVMQLRSAAEAWVAKIAGYDRLLANALSLKGIDICWREAQALKAKQDRQLHEKVTEISREVVSSCSSVVEVNRRFQTEQLKLFEGEPGRYFATGLGHAATVQGWTGIVLMCSQYSPRRLPREMCSPSLIGVG